MLCGVDWRGRGKRRHQHRSLAIVVGCLSNNATYCCTPVSSDAHLQAVFDAVKAFYVGLQRGEVLWL